MKRIVFAMLLLLMITLSSVIQAETKQTSKLDKLIIVNFSSVIQAETKKPSKLDKTKTYYYTVRNDGGVEICGFKNYKDTFLEVPEKIDGKAVRSISANAFKRCEYLDTLNISSSLREFNDNPLQYCENLNKIYVDPDNPVFATIDQVLFNKKEKKLICYPKGLVDKYYEIPTGIKSIGSYSFSGNAHLLSISFPETIETIEINAFRNNLFTEIKLPESIKSIGDFVFEQCVNLSTINIPDKMTKLGKNPFPNCENLKNIIVSENHPTLMVKDSVLFDKTGKILYCYPNGLSKESYNIPTGVQIIENGAFAFSNNLLEITIPDSVITIKEKAFFGCHGLTSINIPNKVKTIEYAAFYNDVNLESITLPDGLTNIGSFALGGCEKLRSITLPSKLTNIPDGFFNQCLGMEEIIVPDTCTKIGNYAFFNCEHLTSIIIPKKVTSIGKSAFTMTGLTSIILHDNIKELGDSVFSNCTNLVSVVLPNKLKSIPSNMFYRCSSLIDVTLPEKLVSIMENAFFGCESLQNLTLSKNVKTIEKDAFARCDNLVLIVEKGSYAAKYCMDNSIPYQFPNQEDTSWLNQ